MISKQCWNNNKKKKMADIICVSYHLAKKRLNWSFKYLPVQRFPSSNMKNGKEKSSHLHPPGLFATLAVSRTLTETSTLLLFHAYKFISKKWGPGLDIQFSK